MSLQRILIDWMLRRQVKRRLKRDPDVLLLRPLMAEMARRGRPPPAGIAIEQTHLGDVPTERIMPDGARADAAIFHIHGGAWVAGSPEAYRPMLWRLAKAAALPLYAPAYRLAPEHPFPAALDDVLAAYAALLDHGYEASHLVVAGDSAGGNLALALILVLKAKGLALPAALICLSPATDLAAHGGSLVSNGESDALFVPEMIETVVRHYCPGHDPTDPLISPLRGDLSGFPPTLIHTAQREMLRDQSIDLQARLIAQGVSCELEIWPKVWHVWHLSADMLPEAREAIARLAQFIRRRLPA